mmetsp:Transcript_60802/g.159899  ORF Transcript_60802/g.159899 Transcript_60802/m.159899 type:complete len:277 (-) Transcript_60802:709-1539(-)
MHVDAGRHAPHAHAPLHKLRHRHLRLDPAERVVHDPGVRGLKPEHPEVDAALVGLDNGLVLLPVDHSVVVMVEVVEDGQEALDEGLLLLALLEDQHVGVGLRGTDGLVHEHAREEVEDAEVVEGGVEDKDCSSSVAGLREQQVVDGPVVAACGSHVQRQHGLFHRAEVVLEVLEQARALTGLLGGAISGHVVLHEVVPDELHEHQGEHRDGEHEQHHTPEEGEARVEEGEDHHPQVREHLDHAHQAQHARELHDAERAKERQLHQDRVAHEVLDDL